MSDDARKDDARKDDARKDDARKDDGGSTDKHDDVMVERDHPQTRKGEPDARGSSEWREDVVPPEGKQAEDEDKRDDSRHISDLAEEAERTRRQALGGDESRNALGGGKAGSE